MNETKEYIKNLALDLPVGATSERSVCPFCSGGSSREHTFNVTRTPEGILYNCFRASCHKGRGFVGSRNVVSDYKPVTKEFKPKLFTRPLYKLPKIIRMWLQDKYRLTDTEIEKAGWKYDAEERRVYMPIFDPRGYEVGAISRSFNGSGVKAITYKFNDVPKFYFPNGELSGDSVVVVEDIISAIRCKRLFGNSVALLGTSFSPEQASFLRKFFSKIIYALDPDASWVAIEHHLAYKLLFDSSRVVQLSADPKDMSDEQLWKEVMCGEKDNQCVPATSGSVRGTTINR